ncbi:hypothetical protein [Neptuniibacter sp.]|uniref:hypothetical protein n=1 Tax=Neptuniibacter sp. TaxID=1962643 RepID=UPI003B59F249
MVVFLSMKTSHKLITLLSGAVLSFSAFAASDKAQNVTAVTQEVVWTSGTDTEALWLRYADSKGGLVWGRSTEYPEYEKVREGDTFIIELKQGPCLMEFFHSRWRRANDVRRWDESINSFGGCPYVFD